MDRLLPFVVFQGFSAGINVGAAPFYGAEFGLDAAGLARVFAWMALGSLLALGLSRAVDRLGRRRMLLVCGWGSTLGGLGVAISGGVADFIGAQVLAGGCRVAAAGAVSVILAEALSDEERARGMSRVGLVGQVAMGVPLVVLWAASEIALSWRWVWVVSATLGPIALFMARRIPESRRFLAEPRRGWSELVQSRYRATAIAALTMRFLVDVAFYSASTWYLYYPQTLLGMSTGEATLIFVSAGAAALIGYPIGAALADRVGRRAALLVTVTVLSAAQVAYYHVPGALLMWTALALALTSLAAGVAPLRSATTELFPTGLRGTVQGALTVAAAAALIVSQTLTAILTQTLDGLVPAITILGLVGLPGVALFYWTVPDTRSLDEG